MKEFYDDLYKWVTQINKVSNEMNEDDYWNHILTTAGQLSQKYHNGDLVKRVILAHIDFLEQGAKQKV